MYDRKYDQAGTKPKKPINANVKFPTIKDKISNIPVKQQPVKSLKLDKISKKNIIAQSDLIKINKIQKQFAQMTKRLSYAEQSEIKSNKKQIIDEMRQSRLLLIKDISSQQPKKNGNKNLLSNLLLFTEPQKSAKTVNIPFSNITSSPKEYKKPRQKSKSKQYSPISKKTPIISLSNVPISDKNLHIAPPTKYKNPTQLLKIDFVKMFIIEQLLYYISKIKQRSKEQIAGFCKFYNENQDENSYFIIEKVLHREKVYLQTIFYEKLGFYIFLILGTDNFHQQSSFMLNSLTGYLHTNNMIILDLMMQIVDYENFQISSQFHVYNTSRFNEARRLIKNNNEDKINLLVKNNAHLLEIIKSILVDCGFDSLKNFVTEILDNEEADIIEKIKQISLMLTSLDTILTSSIEQQLQIKQKKQPQYPFLPQKQKLTKYTLVLDMDETLIHYFQRQNDSNATVANSFLVRPYCLAFLEELAEYFELVIFTAAVKQYADTILDILDKKELISHRLYRQHTRIQDYVSIKDLSLIGRDISKTIIVDNIQSNFKMQPRNGIAISTWIGHPEDQSLAKLIPVLKKIAIDNVQDVRDGLQAISQFMQSSLESNEQINFAKLSLKGL